MIRIAGFAAFACLALSACDPSNNASVRDQIRAVGSSTVFPFAKAVAGQYVNKNPGTKSPIIESTGTGAGMKLFCAGVGARHPDIVTASRRIKRAEFEQCRENGVTNVVEIQIGLDGIAFAESKRGEAIPLTALDVYKALAANPFGKPQTAKTWKDVNPALPDKAIKVYGPPSTSGTRDALTELVLTRGCDVDPAMRALADTNSGEHKKICTTIREDGAFVEAGENDNLIVQKLAGDPNALGVFGFSFLEENLETLNGNSLNGVVPTYETVSNFTYPGARPLYIYVKGAHLNAIKGLKAYVAEFASAWNPDGYLKRAGMVVAPSDIRAANAAQVTALKPLDPAELK
ncbi:MAG: substrate-binding domain-containing protein [Sphingomonadaceae bacterium]